MRTLAKYMALASIALFAWACNSAGDKTKSDTAREVKETTYDQKYVADLSASKIDWEGYKPTGKHHGEVALSGGELMVENGNLTGGSFKIDMNSITVIDLEDPDYNTKLTGHLKSTDFFDVEAYPEGKFEITAVVAIDGTKIDKEKEKGDIVPDHSITGNLTLKGITRSISFNALVKIDKNGISAETNQFFIDRAEWDIQYKSRKFFDDLKDKFINDEMGIAIQLKANAVSHDVASE